MGTTWHGTWNDDAAGTFGTGARYATAGYATAGPSYAVPYATPCGISYGTASRGRSRRRSPETPIAFIGPVRVTTRYVYTPLKTLPLREVSWSVRNRFTARDETPEWALITALVGVPFTLGLSLLLLLVKEPRLSGHVELAVKHASGRYDVRLPVRSWYEVSAIHHGVACARPYSRRGLWASSSRDGYRTAA